MWKRIDLIEIKFELSNRLNEFCAKYEISPAINNVFKKFYENEKLNEKMDELTSKENDPTVDNKTFEDKINEFIKSFNSLKKNVVDTKKLIDQKISDFNVLLKEIRDWKSISPNAADELYLNPNIDANDFMNVLFGSSAGIGEEQKIENYLNETVKKYLVDSNEIGIKLNEFKKTIQDLKTQKRDKHRQTILLKAEIEKFEQLIEANAPKTSQPTGNYDEDKKFIYKPLNVKAKEDVLKFKNVLTSQYSLSDIKKDNFNQNTLDERIKKSVKEYQENLEKANQDLHSYINNNNGDIKFINPNTNTAFVNNELQNVLPSTIQNYLEPASSTLVSTYLQGNLHVDVEMKPDDVNGKMFYTKKYWYAETEYINPNNPSEGKKITNKFYFYSDAQKFLDGFKKFAFTDDDNVIFAVHNEIQEKYETVEAISLSLAQSINNTLVTNDYLTGTNGINDKILLISFNNSNNKKLNSYVFMKCEPKGNDKITIQYSISRRVKSGDKEDQTVVDIKTVEVDFSQIIARNKDKNEASKNKKDVTYFYNLLDQFVQQKLDSQKDEDLISQSKVLLEKVKKDVVDKETNSLNTGTAEFQEFVNKCKEYKQQLIKMYSDITSQKSEKNATYSKFRELKIKVEFLLSNINQSPSKVADKHQEDELTKVKNDIDNILKDNVQTKLAEMQNTLKTSEENFKKNELEIKEKEEARTLLNFAILEVKDKIPQTFVNEKLSAFFKAKAEELIKNAEEVVTKTGTTKDLINSGKTTLENGFNELDSKNAIATENYEQLKLLYDEITIYKNNNLLDKQYLNTYKQKIEQELEKAKNILEKTIEVGQEQQLNDISSTLNSFNNAINNIKQEIIKVVAKYDELLKFINNYASRYAIGLILTKVAAGNEEAIEALQPQDYEDIAKPLVETIDKTKVEMNKENPNVIQNLEKLLVEIKASYEKARNAKIEKDIQKKLLNKTIKEKEQFVTLNITGVWIADVSKISEIFSKEINEAKTKYTASNSNIQAFKDAIKKLEDNTNVASNAAPDNLMTEWDKAQKEASDKIKQFLQDITKFKTEDKEEVGNITIANDNELKNEPEFVNKIEILKKSINGDKLSGDTTFILAGDKYNALDLVFNNIKKHKQLKIQERNEFINTLKNAAFYFNHAKSDNSEQVWSKTEYIGNRDAVPGFSAKEADYKTLEKMNTPEDHFSTSHQDKIDVYRKSIDEKFSVSSVSSNIKTYKTATEELKKFINEYIAARLKALQEAQKEYDRIVQLSTELRNQANTAVAFKKVFDAINTALDTSQQEYSIGLSSLQPNKIKEAANKLEKVYQGQKNLFDSLNQAYTNLNIAYTKFSEDLKLYEQSSLFAQFKTNLENALQKVNTMLTKGKSAGGNNYTGVDSASEISNLEVELETNANNIFAQHQQAVINFFNENYKKKLNEFTTLKDILIAPRDISTGFKTLEQIFAQVSISENSYLGRTPQYLFSKLESTCSQIEAVFATTITNMKQRREIITKFDDALNKAESVKDRSQNFTYACCKSTCSGNKWAKDWEYHVSENHKKTLLNTIDIAKKSNEKEISNEDFTNLLNLLLLHTKNWIDNSGGHGSCRSTIKKCYCGGFHTQV
ncbi:hypothetical protein ACJA25_02255 [Mycoplasmopsis hyopharyngis]|uniref:hypothetical protein n=1 Tax=Mycoplasmopsis hyopharyngis TaxID=29558 RepID=UPI0038733B85